jgi:superfamily II DNA or RNA helicase
MSTRIDGRYHVPLATLSQFDQDRIRHELTFELPDIGYGSATRVVAFEEKGEMLALPKFFGRRRFGTATVDEQTSGAPHACEFQGTLKEVQTDALAAIKTSFSKYDDGGGALCVLPCGFGKTILALAAIAEMRVATLVLVTKGFLADQWEGEARRFLPSASIGRLQRNVAEKADVCIGMVQSLMSREYSYDVLSHYGMVIVDECHHIAAQAFMRALWACPARYILGLSATPERKDGTTPLLHHMLGEICFKRERSATEEPVSVRLVETRTRHPVEMRKATKTVDMTKMVNRLVADKVRNHLIGDVVCKLLAQGRNILLLSDRVQHLSDLKDIVTGMTDDAETPWAIGYYTGSTKRDARLWAENHAQLILSTFHMTKEGFNVPRLDTVILTTPKGSDLEQVIGRVQRPAAHKMAPLVIDLVDATPVFEAMSFRRISFYRQSGYPVVRENGTKRQREDSPPQNLASLTER